MSLLGKEGRGGRRGATSALTPRCHVVQMYSICPYGFFRGKVV